MVWVTQPTSVNANIGESVTLEAKASGPSGITYQWSNSSGAIKGAISEKYTIASVSLADQDNYFCVATASTGSITSDNASIIVDGNSILTELTEYILTENGDYIDWVVTTITPPTIKKQPTTQSVVATTDVIFEVQATGSLPLSYQWRINGNNISGETNSTYKIKASKDITGITCKVSNVAGDAISNSVNLTVGSLPAITKQAKGTTVSKGTKIVLDIDATGSSPLTYQWVHDGNSIAGATTDTYTINTASVTDSGNYKCIVSNSYGSAISNEYVVVVNNSFDAGDIIIAADTVNFSLKTALINKQWDKALPVIVTVTVNKGVKVGSSSTLTPAFFVERLPDGSKVKLINNGYIVGAGGDGGGRGGPEINYSGQPGKNGGNALKLLSDISIINNGIIGGGGGGGGGNWFGRTGIVSNGGGGAGYIVGSGGKNGSVGTLLLGGGGSGAYHVHAGDGGDLGKNGGSSWEGGSPGVAGGTAGLAIDADSIITWFEKKGDVKGIIHNSGSEIISKTI